MSQTMHAVSSASLLLLGSETPPPDLDTRRLRRAYRHMALLTHPDTRRRKGAPDFLHVRQAYEVLARFLATPGRRRRAASEEGASKGWYWTCGLPSRTLRLGEFLFYEGSIAWDVLIRSIVEQRGCRPTLGKLACSLGMVSPSQVDWALGQRQRGERVGDTLVRLGVLHPADLALLVDEQRRMQRPLGWHLVRMGHVPKAEIPRVLVRLWRHNAAHASPAHS